MDNLVHIYSYHSNLNFLYNIDMFIYKNYVIFIVLVYEENTMSGNM